MNIPIINISYFKFILLIIYIYLITKEYYIIGSIGIIILLFQNNYKCNCNNLETFNNQDRYKNKKKKNNDSDQSSNNTNDSDQSSLSSNNTNDSDQSSLSSNNTNDSDQSSNNTNDSDQSSNSVQSSVSDNNEISVTSGSDQSSNASSGDTLVLPNNMKDEFSKLHKAIHEFDIFINKK